MAVVLNEEAGAGGLATPLPGCVAGGMLITLSDIIASLKYEMCSVHEGLQAGLTLLKGRHPLPCSDVTG